MTVNGQLIGSKKRRENQPDTYFGTISIFYQPDGVGVTVSTAGIEVTQGRSNRSFAWASTSAITQDR